NIGVYLYKLNKEILMCMVLSMAMVRYCRTNIHGREQGKYISLNGSNQQLDDVDKYHHQSTCYAYGIRFKYKDQADKAQDHYVTGCDGHKQSDHQSEGLSNECAQNFYRNQNRQKRHWHPWRGKDVFPIIFIPVYIGDNKRKYGQSSCHRNISRQVGRAGNQP